MAKESFTVIGVGAATLDALSIVPEFRADEHVTQAIAYAEDGGGPVATALCVLAAEGHSCVLIDRCGDDVTGQKIRTGLEEFGVSTHHLHVMPGTRSASANILVRQRDGARQIVYAPSTAGELTPDEVDAALFKNTRLLHLNGRHENAARHAVKLAEAHGVTISFDGGAGRWRESLRDLVEASHIRILAREFAERCTGLGDLQEIAAALLRSPAQIVVITGGTSGSHVWTADGAYFHQPAFQADPLIDTTGCGDVYHGRFLHGWLNNWPLERCAEAASQLAALNAQGLGGRYALRQKL